MYIDCCSRTVLTNCGMFVCVCFQMSEYVTATGERLYPVGERGIYASQTNWRGERLVHVRYYSEDLKPSRKGIALRPNEFEDLLTVLPTFVRDESEEEEEEDRKPSKKSSKTKKRKSDEDCASSSDRGSGKKRQYNDK